MEVRHLRKTLARSQAPVAEGLDLASIEPFDVGEDGIGRGGEGLEILLGEVQILFVRYGYDYCIIGVGLR